MDEMLTLSEADYGFVASLLYERFGIHLGTEKRVLVAGRLAKRVRQLGFASFFEYFAYLRADASGNELSEFINRLTTNHSFFFRERDHYDFLEKRVFQDMDARLRREPRHPLRFWSAGCAAGEEVYTLAMLVKEHFSYASATLDCGLLATDISLAALKSAKQGLYAAQKLSELPKPLRAAYFSEKEPELFEVSSEIRDMVLFKRLNLMAESYPFKNPFDVIFCRNVMIYFDQGSRAKVVRSLYDCLKPGGYLFIGHSESIPRADCPFEYVQPAIYRKGAR